jgi:hypothetical protein
MRFLNGIKRSANFSLESLHYVNKYKLIYIKNNLYRKQNRKKIRFILSSNNKTKVMWQVINKEIGNSTHNNHSTHLRNNMESVTDPETVSERFNSFFVDSLDDLSAKNNSHTIKQTSQHFMKSCPKTMFASLVMENEIESVINSLKGNSSAKFDKIPEFLTVYIIF